METPEPQDPLTTRREKNKRGKSNVFCAFNGSLWLNVFRVKMICFFDDDDYLRQVQNREPRRLAVLR
jgi:hypothetical protein